MQLDGKTFYVTGGGSGIGRGIARRLSEAGAHVLIVDADRHAGSDAAAEYGERVRFERCDVADEQAVKRTVTLAARWQRGLHGIVNNAGIADPYNAPIEKLTRARWQRMLDVDLTGPFLVTKHAVPHLRKTRGAIVNIASTRAYMSEPNSEAYSAAKGGLVALTHALAISLGPDVRVNCISPGWIATSELAPRDRRKPPKLSAKDHEQHPVGRVGKPDDIASLCAWLLSDDAGFVTGQDFLADGGMTKKMIYS
ncbi:MAG TPA: SDR family oxidoreductase [Kofleriaceae bacterium]|nr:SDR family oxidoreductase [Kofleriaceae bacterium]